MTQISVERKHNLGREGARQKAQQVVEKLEQRYDVQATWDGDTIVVKRSGANGTVQIDDDSIRIELKLGMMLSMMSGTIQGEIEKALDKALARA
ncbi:polyhydroxyalkanoic acid system family protein [Pseudomonas sp. nanlin1]|uniref:polyhydroxyalkanoic acid system family protein n=1 Tax=Pseudomonas sp. nanlin1 TaxID=3040605 RepID=UPI00388D5E85